MTDVLSVETMRLSDARTIENGTPGRVLMKRAGEGIFAAAEWKPPVAVVCGSGNNAGDGYVLACCFAERGIDCTVYTLSDRFTPDGRFYYDECVRLGVKIQPFTGETDLTGYGSVADCIFGTGFAGEARGLAGAAIEAVNRSGAYVVSADINSGLPGDSGYSECCVRSDLTVSVGAYQPGHFLNMAKDVMKRKTNVDIGILPADTPFSLVTDADAAALFGERKNFSNKSTYGYIGLLGGSERYVGAVKLAALANAAMRAGAGVVKLGVPRTLLPALSPDVLEATLFGLAEADGALAFDPAQAAEFCTGLKAVAIGMGAGRGEGVRRWVTWLLGNFTGRLVIDADGLNALADMDRSVLRNARCRVLLTPHNMEFSRLSGHTVAEILRSPVALAMEYARDTGVTLLLKGPATVVTDGKRTALSDTGCPGMATAGSGDVLSGILAALCGANENVFDCAWCGAYVNGLAGELAQREYGAVSMTAGDTARHVAEAVRGLLARGGPKDAR